MCYSKPQMIIITEGIETWKGTCRPTKHEILYINQSQVSKGRLKSQLFYIDKSQMKEQCANDSFIHVFMLFFWFVWAYKFY